MTASIRTTCRRLLDHGLRSCKARKKPLIKPDQKRKRLAWARRHKNGLKDSGTVCYGLMNPVSSCSQIQGMSGYKEGPEKSGKDCIVPTVKHGSRSVMVWGCMSSSGVGRLTVCDRTINSEKYRAILHDTMLPAAREMFRNGQNYTFQQNNAPRHTSVSTRRWFQTNNVRVMDWPPQSPDMNPIENLWGDLKIAVRRHQPTSKAQLKAVLQDEWHRIAPERCQNLVNSMPTRISALIRAKELCTKY